MTKNKIIAIFLKPFSFYIRRLITVKPSYNQPFKHSGAVKLCWSNIEVHTPQIKCSLTDVSVIYKFAAICCLCACARVCARSRAKSTGVNWGLTVKDSCLDMTVTSALPVHCGIFIHFTAQTQASKQIVDSWHGLNQATIN